jgi:hypothetical protein
VLALAVVGGCGGSDEGSSSDTTSTSTSTTVEATTSTATSTEPPTSTVPPSTPSTVPGPEVAPVSVLLVGDSVGFTLQEHVPDGVPGVASVDGRALAGCGLILEGERPPEAVAAGAPPRYDDCAAGVADADAEGLAADPDVVLLVSGAWEWNDHERSGRTVGPGDEAWAEQLRRLLTDRVEALGGEGATVALWVDPCSPKPGVAPRQAWYRDEVLAPVAEATGAVLVDPAALVCAPDDTPRTDLPGVGDPRPDDGQHWSREGAEWLWSTWLGPTLAAAAAAPGD